MNIRSFFGPKALVIPPLLFAVSSAFAADASSGKSAAVACAGCHEAGDWAGESQSSLESLIRDVVRGTVKHPQKKVALTDAEIAGIAAYWAVTSK